MQDSQRRLYGLELFQFANVEPLNPEQQPDDVPIRVTVAEGKHQRVNFGVGYGTEEKARVDAEYHHVNFLGGARSAGAHARWSSLDRGVRLDFNQPYFFAPHFSLGVEAQQWYTFTPAYDRWSTGAKATLTHRQTPADVVVGVDHERARQQPDHRRRRSHDPTLRNDLIALGLDPTTRRAERHAERARLRPAALDRRQPAERAPRLSDRVPRRGGGPAAARHVQLLRGVRSTAGTTCRSATRSWSPAALQIGNIRPVGDDPTNVPFSKKYFLGGATSIRGWGRYEVSPLSDRPADRRQQHARVQRGTARDAARQLRRRALPRCRQRLGRVAGAFKLDDLRYAVGPGLRYQTPVGPIRFDVGYQLNPIPGLLVNGSPQTRRWRMHFSIGQAF